MQLSQILSVIRVKQIFGNTDIEITGFAMDSRKVQPGYIYVVLTEPELEDRTKFIPAAVEAGASAIVVNRKCEDIPANITQIVVPETQIASALMAAKFYGYPAHNLSLIGITGTKGKTTTSYLIRHLLSENGVSTGVIGTTGARYGTFYEPGNTTPHAINLQRILRQMADMGCQTVCMEVSSHALRLNRAAGLLFRTAVFTNIGSDHMNFHQDLDDYIQAKSMLMCKVIEGSTVINADDEQAAYMLKATAGERLTYGISANAYFRAANIRHSINGTLFDLITPYGSYKVSVPLVGLYNVYNCLAALGVAYSCGMDLAAAVQTLATFTGVPGRMEHVDTQGHGYGIYVDYAHTPESMENVLQTLAATHPNKLITVFGAGGDRDKAKRPKMATIASRYSQYTILTSDNPRTEDPLQILADIEQGIAGKGNYEVLPDRGQAINRAITLAEPGDIIAILGKGDETYQEINHVKYPFDDRQVALTAVRQK